jgi:uracil phosphoribosyltransferase
MDLHVADHPLIAHKLTVLRDETTDSSRFRTLTDELVMLLSYEATRDIRTEPRQVTTPVAKILPTAEVGFLGMVRDDDTFQVHAYAERLPADLTGRQVYVLDPMLATGGTLAMAIDFLLERGVSSVTAVCLVSAPEGVRAISEKYQGVTEVTVHTAALDEKLNERGYIVPGLGDAGDRLYGVV